MPSTAEHDATVIGVNVLLVGLSLSAVTVRLFRPTAKRFEVHDGNCDLHMLQCFC